MQKCNIELSYIIQRNLWLESGEGGFVSCTYNFIIEERWSLVIRHLYGEVEDRLAINTMWHHLKLAILQG